MQVSPRVIVRCVLILSFLVLLLFLVGCLGSNFNNGDNGGDDGTSSESTQECRRDTYTGNHRIAREICEQENFDDGYTICDENEKPECTGFMTHAIYVALCLDPNKNCDTDLAGRVRITCCKPTSTSASENNQEEETGQTGPSTNIQVTQCNDGKDNDDDGYCDTPGGNCINSIPGDFSCTNPEDDDELEPKAQCQDGLDNDSDGKIDWSNANNRDGECDNSQDNSEGALPEICESIEGGNWNKIDNPNEWCCKGGYRDALDGVKCCTNDNTIGDDERITSGDRTSEANKLVNYEYNLALGDAGDFVAYIGGDSEFFNNPIYKTEKNGNIYTFSGQLDSGETVQFSAKLCYDEQQCGVLVGDECVQEGEVECGNEIIDAGEECDTNNNLNGRSCTDFGFTGENLRCDNQCKFDKSECVGYSGESLPFRKTHGSDPNKCEFSNLKWLTPSQYEIDKVYGSSTQKIQGGTGGDYPGEKVVLYANIDQDCDDAQIKFEILEVRGAGDFHFEYLEAEKSTEDGEVWYKKVLEWENWENVFENIQNPIFKFRLISDDGTPKKFESDTSPKLTVLKPTITYCGDGIVQELNGKGKKEVCDKDTRACKTDDGYTGTKVCNNVCSGYETCKTEQYCGDGTKNGDENCDDGKANNGKANKCNSKCTGVTGSVCGNSIKEAGEDCDDGNLQNNDKCSNGCKVTYCGDGIVQELNGKSVSEECDDGDVPASGGDGCSSSCKVESGWNCLDAPSKCSLKCNLLEISWLDESGQKLPDGTKIVGWVEGRLPGEKVYAYIKGDNDCFDKTVKFSIYEDDSPLTKPSKGDDLVVTTEPSLFENDIVIYLWKPLWKPDEYAFSKILEYYFIAETDDGTISDPSNNIKVEQPPLPECNDKAENKYPDNDGDLLIDIEDPGCWEDTTDPGTYDPFDNSENSATSQCQDSLDNDGDKKIDWKNDPGCCNDYGKCDVRDNSENSA